MVVKEIKNVKEIWSRCSEKGRDLCLLCVMMKMMMDVSDGDSRIAKAKKEMKRQG